MTYYPTLRKKEILPFANNMDRTWRQPKWGKSDRERKYCVVTFIGGISKKTELVKTEKWGRGDEGLGELGRCCFKSTNLQLVGK